MWSRSRVATRGAYDDLSFACDVLQTAQVDRASRPIEWLSLHCQDEERGRSKHSSVVQPLRAISTCIKANSPNCVCNYALW